MGKPRRNLPVIDFTSEYVIEWMNEIIERHPEIIRGAVILQNDLSPEGARRVMSDDLRIVAKPGRPEQRGKKIDWEAWFLYYNLYIMAGFSIGYEDIAAEVDRQPLTVKDKFIDIWDAMKLEISLREDIPT